MIHLDTTNGNIRVGDFSITSDLKLADIEKIQQLYDVKKGVENAGFSSYRIPYIDDGESSMMLTFFKAKILKVELGLGKNIDFSPYKITEGKIRIIRNWLAAIGGAHEYPWGNVRYIEDEKGGYIGIRITYNNVEN